MEGECFEMYHFFSSCWTSLDHKPLFLVQLWEPAIDEQTKIKNENKNKEGGLGFSIPHVDEILAARNIRSNKINIEV